MASFDYDVLIIGSGFGGSVAALLAAEKGYRVGGCHDHRTNHRCHPERAGTGATYDIDGGQQLISGA